MDNGQRKKQKKTSAGNDQKKPNGKGKSTLDQNRAEREWLSANNYFGTAVKRAMQAPAVEPRERASLLPRTCLLSTGRARLRRKQHVWGRRLATLLSSTTAAWMALFTAVPTIIVCT